MLQKLFGKIWRRLPKQVRRLNVLLSQDRFTVTAAAVVLDDEGRILLLKHVFRAGSGWGIPGGFIDKGEQPEEAVRREVCEEVGLELDEARLAFVRTLKPFNQVEVYFRCRAAGRAEPRSFEIKDAAWFSLDRLPEGLSRDQRQIIERVLKGDSV